MAQMGHKAQEMKKQQDRANRNLLMLILGVIVVCGLALGISFKDSLSSCFSGCGPEKQEDMTDVSAGDVSMSDLVLATFEKGELYFEYYADVVDVDDQYDEYKSVYLSDSYGMNYNDGFNVYVADDMAGVDLKEFTDGYIGRVASYGEIVDRQDSDSVTEEGYEMHFTSYTFNVKDEAGGEYSNMVAIKIIRDGSRAIIANCSLDANISYGAYNALTRALATVNFSDAA